MDNDKFQELMLEQFGLINKRLDGFEGEMTGIKGEVTGIHKRLDGLEGEMTGIKNDMAEVKNIQIRMENNMGEKLKALFDAHEVQLDGDKKLQQSIDDMAGKLNNLSFRVIPLEQVKVTKRKIK
ncbi:MAG: hypothetical protein PVG90_03940 [Bacillota bacterium]